MTIQPLKNDQAVTNMANTAAQAAAPTKTSQTVDQQQSAQSSSPKALAPGQKTDVTEKSSDAASALRLNSIQEDNVTRSAQARTVHASASVDKKLEEMKEALSSIVKSYPPFPYGSEKRVQYLMSISSIRDQIEAMTIPPDPSKGEATKIWADMFKGVIIAPLVASGPAEATDTEVGAALSAVSTMQAGLADRRSALEKQLGLSAQVSEQLAVQLSQSAAQQLAAKQLPIATHFSEVLKGL
jgi:hypothetical protein